jgi:hypothetical protein
LIDLLSKSDEKNLKKIELADNILSVCNISRRILSMVFYVQVDYTPRFLTPPLVRERRLRQQRPGRPSQVNTVQPSMLYILSAGTGWSLFFRSCYSIRT